MAQSESEKAKANGEKGEEVAEAQQRRATKHNKIVACHSLNARLA